ncbi:site-specific integrase [Ahrensia sp. 13_GOM-1096m]|uniref:tyrosine-type recombinase/integrase n=1 Tax=Ahrensia sp. 13_GOM-1096m TaxID=1380380 RepID=UPI000478EB21|nr:site-specific integrase [Ahrensia sp. 13_GOM-1096m]
MPRLKLTDAFVRNAKPIDGKVTEYADERENGLALRISPAGAKSWTFRYRTKAGQQKRMSLGRTNDVSLSDARSRVVKERAFVSAGGDPVAIAAKAKDAAIEEFKRETVQQVGEWYFQECKVGRHRQNAKPKRVSTLRTELLYFNKHILTKLGSRKLADVSRSMVQAFVNDLADNTSKSAARHCKVILHGIYSFAERQELVDKNPCQHVTVASHEPRERVLSDDELRTIWQTMTPPIEVEGLTVSAGVAYAIQLAMVTLQRRSEVTGMKLSEIDRDQRIWVLPSARTKNKRDHVVPLSVLAIELIDKALNVRSVDSDFVFPSPRDANKPIDGQALTHAFVRMRNVLELGDIRPHDLRRTGATNLTSERLGFPRFTVSKVLNHTSDTGNSAAVTSVYDRNGYLSEKRRALDSWAIRINEIISDRENSNNLVRLTI